MSEPLDEQAVNQLTSELMGLVKEHYLRRPVSRSTAQEVLNSVAVVVAVILAAARQCGDELGAREFFDMALEQQLAEASTPTTLAELN